MNKSCNFIRNVVLPCTALGLFVGFAAGPALAQSDGSGNSAACKALPSHGALRAALLSAQAQANGGFGLDMWATVVNRDGIVCAVAGDAIILGSPRVCLPKTALLQIQSPPSPRNRASKD